MGDAADQPHSLGDLSLAARCLRRRAMGASALERGVVVHRRRRYRAEAARLEGRAYCVERAERQQAQCVPRHGASMWFSPESRSMRMMLLASLVFVGAVVMVLVCFVAVPIGSIVAGTLSGQRGPHVKLDSHCRCGGEPMGCAARGLCCMPWASYDLSPAPRRCALVHFSRLRIFIEWRKAH